MDEDENVLSSQGTMEEQSLTSYTNDLQSSKSPGVGPDQKNNNQSSSLTGHKKSQQSQRTIDQIKQTTGLHHHKGSSVTSSGQPGYIRTGTQRTAYLGSIPSQPTRGFTSSKQGSSTTAGWGTLKQTSSTKKKLNPAMSTSAITSSAAGSKSRQKSSKMGGLSMMNYEPVLNPPSQEGPSKKYSSISMSGGVGGNAHKQVSQMGQVKHKYMSPVLRQEAAPSSKYKR